MFSPALLLRLSFHVQMTTLPSAMRPATNYKSAGTINFICVLCGVIVIAVLVNIVGSGRKREEISPPQSSLVVHPVRTCSDSGCTSADGSERSSATGSLASSSVAPSDKALYNCHNAVRSVFRQPEAITFSDSLKHRRFEDGRLNVAGELYDERGRSWGFVCQLEGDVVRDVSRNVLVLPRFDPR